MTLTKTNPFTYGNPISDPGRFFGRRQETDQVFSRLRNAAFESTSVVGSRRMGKTSLLKYASHSEVVRSYGLDPNKYIFIYLDLQMVGSTSSPGRLFHAILRRLKTRVEHPVVLERLNDFLAQEEPDIYDVSELFDAVDESGLQIVLLLDEFEHVGANTKFGPEFYYGLRSLAIHHKLALVTASQQDLVDLSHSETVRSSPFFNIFTTINLRPFTLAEIQGLLDRYLEGTGVSFAEQEVNLLAEKAGGNPFFTQMGAHFLFNAYQQGTDDQQRRAVLETAFTAQVQPHLLNYWQSTPDEQKVLVALLALLSAGQPEGKRQWSIPQLEKWCRRSGTLIPPLIRRGLVVDAAQEYRLFSPVFAQLVLGQLTTPSSSPQPAAESKEDPKTLASASLPDRIRNKVGGWVASINTQHRDLFLAWLSDPSTAESTLELLGGLQAQFQPSGQEITPQPQAQAVAAEPEPVGLPWDDVELVFTPRPDPATIVRLCQWLRETAKGEVDEISETGPAYTSLRVFLNENAPLPDMLANLPEVSEVREEQSGAEGQRGHFLKKRIDMSGTSPKVITGGEARRHLRVVLRTS